VSRRGIPTLRIELELEQSVGTVFLMADSYEDELRLRAWLRRSEAMATLPEVARHLLDELDGCDREAPA
jgi:hypothetical protein